MVAVAGVIAALDVAVTVTPLAVAVDDVPVVQAPVMPAWAGCAPMTSANTLTNASRKSATIFDFITLDCRTQITHKIRAKVDCAIG
jgi:hypothetical protein